MEKRSYISVRSEMKSGDLLEWRSGGVLGPAIRFFSKQNVNHTSLLLGLDKYLEYSEPHKFVLEANPPGIELSLVSRKLEDFNGKCYWLKLKDKFDPCRPEIERFGCDCAGLPYGYKSLFQNILGHISASARELFCSAFAFIAEVAGGCLPEFHYDSNNKSVFNQDGMPVMAPRPGEFGKYGIFEDAIELVF